jgi:hypothetical protein
MDRPAPAKPRVDRQRSAPEGRENLRFQPKAAQGTLRRIAALLETGGREP